MKLPMRPAERRIGLTVVVALAVCGVWILASVTDCLPSPTTPRADATDSAWSQAMPPAGFDAGSGSGGY